MMKDAPEPQEELPPRELKLLTPFRYLRYSHDEVWLRRFGLLACAGVVAALDAGSIRLTGEAVQLTGVDGVVASLANPFGIFAGVYVGLVGVMYAVDNKRLDDLLQSAPSHPDEPNGVTVRTFIIDLLAYGAAAATLTALVLPYLSSLFASVDLPPNLRPFGVSALAVWVLHQVATLLLGIRFMQKNL